MIPTTIAIEAHVIHAYDEDAASWRPEKPIGWIYTIPNEPMSYDEFIENSLNLLRVRRRRPNDLQWLNPQGPGDWYIALDREWNSQPSFIAPWPKSEVLATILTNANIIAPPPGSKKHRELVLCFRPAPRTRSASPVSQASTNRFDDIAQSIVDEAMKWKDSKSRVKQEIKQEIKQDIKQEHKRKRSEGAQRRADAEEGRGLTGRPGERGGLRSSSR